MNTAAALAMFRAGSSAAYYTAALAAAASAVSPPDLAFVEVGTLQRQGWTLGEKFRTPRLPMTAFANLGTMTTYAAVRQLLPTLAQGGGRPRRPDNLEGRGSIRGYSGGRKRIVVVPGRIAPGGGRRRRRGERYGDNYRTGNASPGGIQTSVGDMSSLWMDRIEIEGQEGGGSRRFQRSRRHQGGERAAHQNTVGGIASRGSIQNSWRCLPTQPVDKVLGQFL